MHGSPTPWLLFIPVLIIFSVDYYVFQGIQTITQTLKWRSFWNILYWLIAIVPVVLIVSGFGSISKPGGLSAFQQLVFNLFITLFVTKIFVLIFLLGEDIVRVFTGLFKKVSGTTTDGAPAMPARREMVSKIALMVAAVPFASFIYGITKGKYSYKVHRKELFFKELPEEFDGLTITQISDVHAGSFDDKSAVEEGIKIIKELNSDVFVFTGDLVNNRAEEIVPYKDIFGSIRAKYGQFSILGNHDYGDYVAWESPQHKMENLNRLKQHHADMGYQLLLDEHIRIQKNKQSIVFAGVENWGKGFGERGDLQQALKGTTHQDFKVLLSHDPSHWDEQVKVNENPVHLTLSGHTHGMQMGVEIPGFRWSPVKYRYKNWAGIASHEDRHLYVNRGYGFIGFTGRVGIWPEITVLTLRKG
ncbi:MAG: metallophosphoesterase [Bacteroidia bacterium]